jgi:chemosensory pili system protein ChpA (sensor histidine kinase/response regulator)
MARPRVLLAHGNADCRKIYGSVLTHEGYEVDLSSDLETALGHLARGHCDVIVADLYLFGEDDECLLRIVKSSPMAAHIPFVVLTGWTTEPHRRLALELGADHFLPLPVRPRELLALLANVVAPADMRPASSLRTSDPNDHSVANGF